MTDFHIHSHFSDGKHSIADIVDYYGRRGFGAIAITDHLCETNTFLGRGAAYLERTSKKVVIDDAEVALTPFEFKLLSALMMQAGTVMERPALVALIQGSDVSVVDRTIDTLILGLRKKLGNKADLIETVRGFGYRFRK